MIYIYIYDICELKVGFKAQSRVCKKMCLELGVIIQGPFRGRKKPPLGQFKPLLGHFKPPQATPNVGPEGAEKGLFRLFCCPQEGPWLFVA